MSIAQDESDDQRQREKIERYRQAYGGPRASRLEEALAAHYTPPPRRRRLAWWGVPLAIAVILATTIFTIIVANQ